MASGMKAEPRYHDTVTMPAPSHPHGVRVVMTEDGPLESLLAYMAFVGDRSPSWQSKTASAVGLLYDYHRAAPPTTVEEQRTFLSRFSNALRSGTWVGDGSDPAELFWPPLPARKQAEVINAITRFSDWCADRTGAPPLNPTRAATFRERLATFRRLDRQNDRSTFKHLGNRAQMWRAAGTVHEVAAPQAPKSTPRRPPFFPLDAVRPLLMTGFRRRLHGAYWEQFDVRGQMIVILQRFGGLRASEPFHLFVQDVEPLVHDPHDPADGTSARVRLFHPSEGRTAYKDPLTGRLSLVPRAQFLEARYGRRPRNRMDWHGEYAGWKDLMLEDAKQHFANVHWFPREWGTRFWWLMDIYIRHVRPRGLDGHPYLFVNLGGDEGQCGAPYRLDSYYESLGAAVRKIGLTPSKELGTTSHGLRHAYGQVLSKLKVPRKFIQVFMHHAAPGSQDVYTQPEAGDAARELDAAYGRLAAGSIERAPEPDILLPPPLPAAPPRLHGARG